MKMELVIDADLIEQMKAEFNDHFGKSWKLLSFNAYELYRFNKQGVLFRIRALESIAMTIEFESVLNINFNAREIDGSLALTYFKCYREFINNKQLL